MHIRFHSFIVISIIFLLAACQRPKQENQQPPDQSSPSIKAMFDTRSLPRYFEPSDSLHTQNLPLWMRGGRSGPVRQIIFIKDGKYVVTRAEDFTSFVQSVMRVHEFISGKLVQTIRFNGSSSAVSHSGQLLASEEYHTDHYWHDIHIWNLQQGVELRKFLAPSRVNQIIFSSDDKTIATCGDKGFICIWDVDTGKLLQSYQGFKEDVWNILFSLDDSLLIARGGFRYECGIKIWNTKTGELKLSIPTNSLDARAIALSPNGEFLAFSQSSDSMSLLQLRSGQISTRFTTKDKFPQTLSFSPDSKMLLLGSDGFHNIHMGDDYDKTLLLWEMDDTVPKLELTGHDSDVKTSTFSPDGTLIVCGLENGSVPLWDARTGNFIRKDINRTSQVRAASFSVDGESVITIDAEGVICKWNSEHGHLLSTSQFEGAIGSAAAIHAKDDLIAFSEAYTGVININSANTGKSIKSMSIAEEEHSAEEKNSEEETDNSAPEIEIRQIVFSKNENFLLAGTQEEIFLIETKTGKSLNKFKTEWQPYIFLTFSQDERQYAASLMNARTVLVWKTNSQESPIELLVTEHNYPHKMTFSNDGIYIAVAYNYGPVRIWNIADKKIEKLLEPEASSLAYSCDGNYLATSDIHGTVNIWDSKTYTLVEKLRTAFQARYETLQWSVSGKYILGLTEDGAIAVWNVPELSK